MSYKIIKSDEYIYTPGDKYNIMVNPTIDYIFYAINKSNIIIDYGQSEFMNIYDFQKFCQSENVFVICLFNIRKKSIRCHEIFYGLLFDDDVPEYFYLTNGCDKIKVFTYGQKLVKYPIPVISMVFQTLTIDIPDNYTFRHLYVIIHNDIKQILTNNMFHICPAKFPPKLLVFIEGCMVTKSINKVPSLKNLIIHYAMKEHIDIPYNYPQKLLEFKNCLKDYE